MAAIDYLSEYHDYFLIYYRNGKQKAIYIVISAMSVCFWLPIYKFIKKRI